MSGFSLRYLVVLMTPGYRDRQRIGTNRIHRTRVAFRKNLRSILYPIARPLPRLEYPLAAKNFGTPAAFLFHALNTNTFPYDVAVMKMNSSHSTAVDQFFN